MSHSILPGVEQTSDTLSQYLYHLEQVMLDGGFGPITGIQSIVDKLKAAPTALFSQKALPSVPLTNLGIGPSTAWYMATPDDLPPGVPFVYLHKLDAPSVTSDKLYSALVYGVSSAFESPIGMGALPYVSTKSGIPSTADKAQYSSTTNPKEYEKITYLKNKFPIVPKVTTKTGKVYSFRTKSVIGEAVEHTGTIALDQASGHMSPKKSHQINPNRDSILSRYYIPNPTAYTWILASIGDAVGTPPARYTMKVQLGYSFYPPSEENMSTEVEATKNTLGHQNIPTVSNYYGQMVSPMQTHYNDRTPKAAVGNPMGVTMAPFLVGHGVSYNAPYLPYSNAWDDSLEDHIIRSYRVDAPKPPEGTVMFEHEYMANTISGERKKHYAHYYPATNWGGEALEVPQVVRGSINLGAGGSVAIENLGFIPDIVHLTAMGYSGQTVLWDTLSFRNEQINEMSGQTTRNNSSTSDGQALNGDKYTVTFSAATNGSVLIRSTVPVPGLDQANSPFLDYVIIGRAGAITECYMITQ